jgi:membrane protein
LLENTQGGVIAGVGIAALFWTVIKVLGNIEASFNDIWGVKEPRTFVRKLSDYLSVMLLCPILLIMSSSITVFVSTQIVLITEKVALLGIISPIIYFALKLLPYCVIWILFTFIYMFMPNIKVNFKSALLAGIVAGTIYEIVQLIYINFQVGVAQYNAIYGSFAALPLFLIWLQLSWFIVLYGAEISFAHQNIDTYEHEPDSLQISVHFKKLLSLEVAHLIIVNFSKGTEPLTASQVSHTLEIPIRLVRQIIYELVESRVISETKTEELRESAYQPARDINGLTIQCVIEELEKSGDDNIPVMRTKELDVLSETLESFGVTIKKSPSNKLLKDL